VKPDLENKITPNRDHRHSPVFLFYIKVPPRGLICQSQLKEFLLTLFHCYRLQVPYSPETVFWSLSFLLKKDKTNIEFINSHYIKYI
jgi:hypothetical protein